MPLTYIGALGDSAWDDLLSHALSHADSFLLNMPDGPGELSNGRATFEALPGTTIGPWSGMSGAVQLAGPLSTEARQAFRAAESSLELLDPAKKLWDYRLLRNERILLSVSDFTDLMIDEAVLGSPIVHRLDIRTA